ncbi:4Fe-4S dicluster domain-containing protein, partial [Tepidanaerobacter acetatoxydans]|uniref:4Fe-4S dicluster domain-containing protein n=1 Tax=Tepidanaerobacter acetatoxydans TaxID=499229 RepID=UPI001BD30456
SLAVRFNEDELLFDIKDEEFKSYFEDKNREDFDLQFIEQNEVNVDIPEIPNKDVLNKLKKHSMWDEYNKRCIGCGSCTVACSTCTCFTTSDVIYNENINAGERRRIQSSCQPEGLEFDVMAGGISFRNTQADRYRFKILHKIHDYKERFGDNHMCVGCGRCITRCPEHISIMATIKKISKALKEICGGEV